MRSIDLAYYPCMIRRMVLGTVLVSSSLVVVAHQASASDGAIAPSAVACIAPNTGVIGFTGPQGDTGATGIAAVNGPMRTAHMVTGELPLCTTIPGLCAYPVLGPQGVQGPTGATGPDLSAGQPRRVHVAGGDIDTYCEGLSRDCWFAVGPQGPTGPVGDTGANAPLGGIDGPGRRVHGKADFYRPGQEVTLANCELPTTGGGSTSMLPFAVALLGVGAVAVLTGRRRRAGSLPG